MRCYIAWCVTFFTVSFMASLTVTMGCAALGFQPTPRPKIKKIGLPVCQGVMPVLVSSELSPIWDEWVDRAIKRWNAELGQEVLVPFGRHDFEEMHRNRELPRLPPYITISKISMVQDMELRAHAVERAQRLGLEKPLYYGATAYIHYGLEGVLQICLRGTRILVYDLPQDKMSGDVRYYELLHEVGHALGLGVSQHSKESGTVMYDTVQIADNGALLSSFDLGEDTRAEIRRLYPNN